MTVDARHHKHFVARRGEVLHRIGDEFGGVMISFPRPGVQSDRVVLKGAKECIEAAKQRIMEIVADLEAMITIECIIPQRNHRTVMGAKGSKVQAITAEFEVLIKFPDRDAQEEYPNKDEEMNGDLESEPVRMCDVIRITGKQENVHAAKQALLDLVPVTIDVDIPFDFHRSIIGQKGRDVRELMNKYDVHIVLSPADQHLDIIKISGTPTNVEDAKLAIQERCKELESEKEDRKLRSFELKFEVDPEFHPKIIGRRGAVINKIRTDHNVQINFPKKGDPEENIITVQGYEQSTHEAKEAILKIVNDWNDLYKEDITIDARVHSRLIGTKGRNIRKLMEDYKVEIKFPRNEDPNPNIVTISGAEENVIEAKDHLLNLEEEFMQDVSENEIRDSYRPQIMSLADALEEPQVRNARNARGDDTPGPGFVVKGAPWEQRAPNTASVEEFPTFGARGVPVEAPPVHSQMAGPWGQRR